MPNIFQDRTLQCHIFHVIWTAEEGWGTMVFSWSLNEPICKNIFWDWFYHLNLTGYIYFHSLLIFNWNMNFVSGRSKKSCLFTSKQFSAQFHFACHLIFLLWFFMALCDGCWLLLFDFSLISCYLLTILNSATNYLVNFMKKLD